MADDAFMYFHSSSKIKGETSDASMKDAFELKSLTFGMENSTSIGSATSGAGQGKTTFNPISITKQVDVASCALSSSCSLGLHQKEAYIELRRAGGGGSSSGATFMKFSFKEVAVTKVEWSGTGGEENLEESIDFVYGAIKVEYWKQKSDGNMDTSNKKEALWSVVKNTASFETN